MRDNSRQPGAATTRTSPAAAEHADDQLGDQFYRVGRAGRYGPPPHP